jgi:hypothetical protein
MEKLADSVKLLQHSHLLILSLCIPELLPALGFLTANCFGLRKLMIRYIGTPSGELLASSVLAHTG